jgi:hypothetical protein
VNVREAFRAQAVHCAGMGSPFTARLSTLAAERLAPGDPVSDRVLGNGSSGASIRRKARCRT